MTNDQRIFARLKLHREIMNQLVKMGYPAGIASREALRRMESHPRLKCWRDHFTAVEIEGVSLKHE